MCKRKQNQEKIKKYQTEVNFRLDYFARPGSLDRLFDSMPKDMEYYEYKPTEEEQQIIGYDDVASCLQKTLTELLFYTCKVLKSKEGPDITIYVHRNFVSVQTYTSSSDDNASIAEFVSGILCLFLNDSDFNIEDFSTRVTFACLGVHKNELWSVFDHTAFPVLDDAEVKNGTYQDTHQVGDFIIDLMRNIRTNDDGTIDGVVTTTALCPEESIRNQLKTVSQSKFLLNIISESISEITRCFTD